LDTFHKRLAAFQNLDVTVGPQLVWYNDFFGYADHRRFDAAGKVIKK